MKKQKQDQPTGDENFATAKALVTLRPREVVEQAKGCKHLSSKDDRLVQFLLSELDRLELSTRPSAGSSSAVGKDDAAFQALKYTALLAQQVAEWAFNHMDGLAVQGLMQGSSNKSDSKATGRVNDDHAYEALGRLSSPLDPARAQLLLLNVLRPMSSGIQIFIDAIEALEALQFGETLPIFAQAKTSKRKGLLDHRARLTAVCHMAYEKQKGINKSITRDEVAELFAANGDSIKDWRAELRRALGSELIEEAIKRAEACGKRYRREPADSVLRPHYERLYGKPALQQAAEAYKARSRKK